MASKKRKPATKWAMLGAIGFTVSVQESDGTWGHTHLVIAWAWSNRGAMRAVVCLNAGPYMLTQGEQKKASFGRERLT